MKKSEINKYVSEKKYDELIELLQDEIDEDDEVVLYSLSRCYCTVGKTSDAREIAKQYKFLFPAGDYIEEINAILEDASNGIYKDEQKAEVQPDKKQAAVKKDDSIAKETPEQAPQKEESLLSTFSSGTKKKKDRKIPRSIAGYFKESNIVGMDGAGSPKEKLGTFYNQLRVQKERTDININKKTIENTNFIISGARGSGKTELTKIIAQMLCDFGFRATNDISVVKSRKLVEIYNNDHEKGIANYFQNNSDDVIVIDNLQDILLDNGQNGGFDGMFEALREYMKDAPSSVIITGTEEAVNKMFSLDNDIRDYVHEYIEIGKYTPKELVKIAEKLAGESQYFFDESAKKSLEKQLKIFGKSPDFMNAISLQRMVDAAKKRMADRYVDEDDDSDDALLTLIGEDFSDGLDDGSIEEILAELDGMIGLTGVKEKVREIIETVQFNMMAEETAENNDDESADASQRSLHLLLEGNPGTGKTTIVEKIGRIYKLLGILPNGDKVVNASRADMVGQYQGETAKLVQEKFKEADGGILFIDEAYSLWKGKGDTFGSEAVDQIIKEMEDRKDSMMLVLAGYKKDMEAFIRDSNDGWNRRFGASNIIEFEDYTVEEMAAIFEQKVKKKKFKLDSKCKDAIMPLLEVKSKVPNFGNAGGVENVLDEVISKTKRRTLDIKKKTGENPSAEVQKTITLEDIEAVSGAKSTNEKTVEELLAELNSLTGLESAKQVINDLVDSIQVKKVEKEMGLDSSEGYGTLHLLFKGSAGTGKTTVARLLGEIYAKLGVLQKNIFIEAGRENLVGEHVGETAPKVIELLNRADGGILFIDEAYSLVDGPNASFGQEAINTLVAQMENRRDHLMVIMAGYPDDMDKLLSTNEGLSSRFAQEVIFEDYSIDDLVVIFKQMVCEKDKKNPYKLESAVTDEVLAKAIRARKSKEIGFANARGIRNMLQAIKRKMDRRIGELRKEGKEITPEILRTIMKSDLDV